MSADFKSSPNVNGAAFDPESEIDPTKVLVPEVVRVNEQRVAKGFWSVPGCVSWPSGET